MSMMQVQSEIVPGDRIGDISIGSPLIVVAQALRDGRENFGIIRVHHHAGSAGGEQQGRVPQARKDSESPQGIELLSDRRKLRFYFHPTTQLLEKMVVEELHTTELLYRSTVLSGPNRNTTFAHVYDTLGPTFQGSMDPNTGIYRLKYPGIEVDFPIPAKYHSEFAGRGSHPTRLPDGSIPVAVRITVLKTLPCTESLLQRDARHTRGRVTAGDVAHFDWTKKILQFSSSGVAVSLGATPHEVMFALGCSPRSIFNIMDNRLNIHAMPSSVGVRNGPQLEARLPMYCFNYPLLGVDFIFNGCHRLEKIMLHNPQPWHDTFLKYQRCNYRLECPWSLRVTTRMETTTQSSPNKTLLNDYEWTEEDDAFAEEHHVRPLISSTHCSNGLVLKIYAFCEIVLYVMPALRRVVKVLLCSNAPAQAIGSIADVTEAMTVSTAMAPEGSIDAIVRDDFDALSPVYRPSTSSPDDGMHVQETAPPSQMMHRHIDPNRDEDVGAGDCEQVVASSSTWGEDDRTHTAPPPLECQFGDEEDEPQTNDADEAYSIPPPMPAGHSRMRENGEEDQYTDDFEHSSHHYSARSSSWTPSAHRSPELAPVPASGEDISDDHWGQSAPSGEEVDEPSQQDNHEGQLQETEAQDDAEDSATQAPAAQPQGRSTNSPGSSSASSKSKKKNKKKR